MVNFGARLQTLTNAGWPYIQYEELKRIIDELEKSSDVGVSNDFLKALSADISKVDSFVKDKVDKLKGQLKPDATEGVLLKLRTELSDIRQYIGTNVIAATKIVKKHDKHVDPSLQKREAIAKLVLGAAGLASLPEFHKEVERALASKGVSLSDANSLTIELATGSAGDEESEAALKSLPRWLLQDQRSDTFAAFLDDWTLDGMDNEEGLAHDEELSRDAAVWDVDFSDNATPFWQLSHLQKLKVVLILTLKVSVILFFLYAFICSLSFMANGFRLVAGRNAGEVFRNSDLFNNPVAGMLAGVLVTVLVQSSSTSTSIVITMVAAELLTVKQAIPLIMGANIGTSVTSTIVAMGQIGNKDEFQRAFAAATVHDMFNFLTVLIVLPLEAATGMLYRISKAIIDSTPNLESGEKPPDFLKQITKPFTSEVMKVDKKLIAKIAKATTAEDRAKYDNARFLVYLFDAGPDDLTDGEAGAIVLVCSLLILCISLFAIVWTLKSILKGRIAVWLHKSVNGDIPDLKIGSITIPLGWLTGYLAIGVGVFVTIMVQSSSITTSALTPLVGVGVIKLERMYPTVLGANIGTCITGVLAALAADASKLFLTLQVAYAHLFFNLIGIFIWYVIWPLRAVPISMAKFMGRTTAKYRWFALAYLFFAFFLIPLIFMGLAFAGPGPLITVIVLVLLTGGAVATIHFMQIYRPHLLPAKLRTWDFLPAYLRTLDPMDRIVCTPLGRFLAPMCSCCSKSKGTTTTVTSIPKTKGKAAPPSEAAHTSTTASSNASEIEVAAARISNAPGTEEV